MSDRDGRTVPLGESCHTCGFVHPRCRGHAKHSNPERRAAAVERWGTNGPFPCMVFPPKGSGSEVCRMHGLKAPQVKAAGERRHEQVQVLGRMGELMAQAGAHTDDLDDPEAFITTIRRVRRAVWALDSMVAELDHATGFDRFGQEVPHPLLGLHHKYLTLLGGLEEGALKLGLAVHRQQFHERQVTAIGTMVRELVSGLGRRLDDPEVIPVVERVLALVADTDEAA